MKSKKEKREPPPKIVNQKKGKEKIEKMELE